MPPVLANPASALQARIPAARAKKHGRSTAFQAVRLPLPAHACRTLAGPRSSQTWKKKKGSRGEQIKKGSRVIKMRCTAQSGRTSETSRTRRGKTRRGKWPNRGRTSYRSIVVAIRPPPDKQDWTGEGDLSSAQSSAQSEKDVQKSKRMPACPQKHVCLPATACPQKDACLPASAVTPTTRNLPEAMRTSAPGAREAMEGWVG